MDGIVNVSTKAWHMFGDLQVIHMNIGGLWQLASLDVQQKEQDQDEGEFQALHDHLEENENKAGGRIPLCIIQHYIQENNTLIMEA